MKRIKIISFTISMILIIGLSFTFAGCDEFLIEEAIGFGYDVAYAESGSDGASLYGSQYSGACIDGNCIALLRSKQELIAFSDEKELSFFEVKGEDRYHIQQRIYESDLSTKIRSYNESYFNEKSLVLVFVEFPNVYPAKIDSVAVEEEDLVVKVARPEADSFLDAESHHAFVVEVDKASIDNMTARLMIIRKGVTDDYLDENGKYNW